MTVLGHVVLFVERPADALGGPSLYLPFNVARMDGDARVLECGAADHVGLAGVGIDPDIDDHGGVCTGGAGGCDVGAANDWSARGVGRLGDLPVRHAQLGIGDVSERTVIVPDVSNVRLPDLSRPLDELSLHVVRRLVRSIAGLEGDAAPAGVGRVADGVGVADLRHDVLDGDAQHLGELLRDGSARAADVDRTLDEADLAVGLHVCDDARGSSAISP